MIMFVESSGDRAKSPNGAELSSLLTEDLFWHQLSAWMWQEYDMHVSPDPLLILQGKRAFC